MCSLASVAAVLAFRNPEASLHASSRHLPGPHGCLQTCWDSAKGYGRALPTRILGKGRAFAATRSTICACASFVRCSEKPHAARLLQLYRPAKGVPAMDRQNMRSTSVQRERRTYVVGIQVCLAMPSVSQAPACSQRAKSEHSTWKGISLKTHVPSMKSCRSPHSLQKNSISHAISLESRSSCTKTWASRGAQRPRTVRL